MSETIISVPSPAVEAVNGAKREVSGLWNRICASPWTSFSSYTVRPTLIAVHLTALLVFFIRPGWKDLVLFVSLYLATGFGITIGFHRLLTHRGFESPGWFTALLAFLGTAAMQGGPLWWVGVHRRHHQTSDKDTDPHTPRESLFFGHMGWMFKRDGLTTYPRLVRDLATNRFLVMLDSGPFGLVPALCTVAICYLVDGFAGVVWGFAFRTVWVWHATWCVNSVCHRWGTKPNKLKDNSGNVWWVGLWALGEGWHNNHHAYPRAAIHEFHWWEIDPSGIVLRFLERVGLVRDVVRAGSDLEEAKSV